jgi:hypothetical protein
MSFYDHIRVEWDKSIPEANDPSVSAAILPTPSHHEDH